MKIYAKRDSFKILYIKLVFDKFIEELKEEEVYTLYHITDRDSEVQLSCNIRSYNITINQMEEIDLQKLNYEELYTIVYKIGSMILYYYFPSIKNEILNFVKTVKEIIKERNYDDTKQFEYRMKIILEEINKYEQKENDYKNNNCKSWIDLISNNKNKSILIYLYKTPFYIYYLENYCIKKIYYRYYNVYNSTKIEEYEFLFNEELIKNFKKNSTKQFLKKFEKEKKKSIINKKVSTSLFYMIIFKDLILERLKQIEQNINI